jgi:hypothetical protein
VWDYGSFVLLALGYKPTDRKVQIANLNQRVWRFFVGVTAYCGTGGTSGKLLNP